MKLLTVPVRRDKDDDFEVASGKDKGLAFACWEILERDWFPELEGVERGWAVFYNVPAANRVKLSPCEYVASYEYNGPDVLADGQSVLAFSRLHELVCWLMAKHNLKAVYVQAEYMG